MSSTIGLQTSDELKLDGVALSKLALVRVQAGLEGARADEHGRLVLSRAGSGREETMNTFHFALNGAVSNHVLGKFDHPVVIIASLRDTCALDGQRPVGLDGADTYFHANADREMVLAESTLIVPEGVAVPAGFAGHIVFYEAGGAVTEMLGRRDAAIASELERRGVPERVVAPSGWRGERLSKFDEYKALAAELGCPALKRQLHMNAPDGALEAHFGLFEAAKRSFTAGERLHTADDGLQTLLVDYCAIKIADMQRSISDLMSQTACDNAKAFYAPKLEKAEATLERMLKLVGIEAARADELAAKEAGLPKEWYLGINGQPVGPMTVAEVRDFAHETFIDGRTPVWRAGMAAWSSAAMEVALHQALPHLAPPAPAATQFANVEAGLEGSTLALHGVRLGVSASHLEDVDVAPRKCAGPSMGM
jgi:hypothetical protein